MRHWPELLRRILGTSIPTVGEKGSLASSDYGSSKRFRALRGTGMEFFPGLEVAWLGGPIVRLYTEPLEL